MKGINMFCASQATAAICPSTSMEDQPSPSSLSSPSSSPSSSSCNNNILPSSSPAIDRYNPIIRDSSRIPKTQPPIIIPKTPLRSSPHHHNKNKNNKTNNRNRRILVKDQDQDLQSKKSHQVSTPNTGDDAIEIINKKDDDGDASSVANKTWVPTNISTSPPSSTRYLLKEETSSNLFVEEPSNVAKDAKTDQEGLSCDPPPYQVVVLRVSLHCRGCERKMRKHLSKMEGVTSFNIDFAAKKVTVSGNVTPLEVLSSISKVKNAQLWPPTTISSSSPSSSSPNATPINFGTSRVYVRDKGVFVS